MKWASKFGTALLLALSACEDGFLVIRTGVFAGGSHHGHITATVNDYGWNSSHTSGHYSGGVIIIIAWGYDQFDRRVDMKLTMRSTVGTATQVIGGDELVSAEIIRSGDGQSQTWTAGGRRGTGSFMLTSLSAEHAEGRFEFVASGTSTSSAPATYRIARGSFNVSIQ